MDIGKLKYKSLLLVSVDENENLHTPLNNIFKTVYIEKDHTQCMQKYFGEHRSSDAEIDLVLFDITPENITTLQQIRDINKKIPIMLISDDYTPIDTLVCSQQKIYHAFEKPLDEKQLSIEAYYALKEVSKRKFNGYLRQVAMVSKTDVKGKIIYVNDLFSEVTGYTKEELINQPHNIVRHPANPKSLYENLWNTIQSGHTWHGIIKNKKKNEEVYYINSTIFPTCNSKQEIIGYLSIAFEVTTEEQNKAKLKHYILSQKSAQIQSNKDFETKVASRIEQALVNEKHKFNELKKIAYELEDSLNQTKTSKKQLANRVHYLEDALKKVSDKDKSSETQLKQLLKQTRQEAYETHKKNEKLEKLNETLSEKLLKAQESVQIFQGYIDEYRKKIDNLNDVIASYERDKK